MIEVEAHYSVASRKWLFVVQISPEDLDILEANLYGYGPTNDYTLVAIGDAIVTAKRETGDL